MKLTGMGYKFELVEDKVRYSYEGPGDPDPTTVKPLMDLVRQHKDEVRQFLRVHCPKCGGMCYGTFADGEERCMSCYYQALKALNPGLDLNH